MDLRTEQGYLARHEVGATVDCISASVEELMRMANTTNGATDKSPAITAKDGLMLSLELAHAPPQHVVEGQHKMASLSTWIKPDKMAEKKLVRHATTKKMTASTTNTKACSMEVYANMHKVGDVSAYPSPTARALAEASCVMANHIAQHVHGLAAVANMGSSTSWAHIRGHRRLLHAFAMTLLLSLKEVAAPMLADGANADDDGGEEHGAAPASSTTASATSAPPPTTTTTTSAANDEPIRKDTSSSSPEAMADAFFTILLMKNNTANKTQRELAEHLATILVEGSCADFPTTRWRGALRLARFVAANLRDDDDDAPSMGIILLRALLLHLDAALLEKLVAHLRPPTRVCDAENAAPSMQRMPNSAVMEEVDADVLRCLSASVARHQRTHAAELDDVGVAALVVLCEPYWLWASYPYTSMWAHYHLHTSSG